MNDIYIIMATKIIKELSNMHIFSLLVLHLLSLISSGTKPQVWGLYEDQTHFTVGIVYQLSFLTITP